MPIKNYKIMPINLGQNTEKHGILAFFYYQNEQVIAEEYHRVINAVFVAELWSNSTYFP